MPHSSMQMFLDSPGPTQSAIDSTAGGSPTHLQIIFVARELLRRRTSRVHTRNFPRFHVSEALIEATLSTEVVYTLPQSVSEQ